MYHQPFGSLFSDNTYDATFAPIKDNIPEDKPTVDTIPFKETDEIKLVDPKAQLAQSDYNLKDKTQKFNLLQADVNAVKAKNQSSKDYSSLLTEYMNLSNVDKNRVNTWIKNQTQPIQNLITAKKLQKIATKTQIQTAGIDLKLKHLENLSNLNKQGVDIRGSADLKYYRPTQTKVTTSLPIDRNISKIKGKVPMDQLYTLTQLGGLAGSEESYFHKFKEGLPSPMDYKNARQQNFQDSQTRKKIEQALLLSKQMDWKTDSLNKEKNDQLKLYNDQKNMLTDLVKRTNAPAEVTTSIGVLVDTFPDKFKNAKLLDLIKTPLKKSQSEQPKNSLGNFGQGDTATGVINALGNAINGIISSITTSKVLTSLSKDKRDVAITTAVQNTEKLKISTEGQVQQEQIQVQNVQATYGGITKLVLGAGIVISGVIVAGAFAYSLASKARGDYEVEYQVK